MNVICQEVFLVLVVIVKHIHTLFALRIHGSRNRFRKVLNASVEHIGLLLLATQL